MKRIFFVMSVLLSVHISGIAQSDYTDSLLRAKKKNYKYLGIQANLLLQQFISFNSNSSINTNPYIFCFAKSDLKTGWGFALGTGLNVSEKSSNDGVASVTVQDVNVTLRTGGEKKFLQNEKFIPFIGFDGAFGVIYNKTSSRLNQSVTNNQTIVETTKFFIGPSFRGGLLYSLSKHILVGTEFFFNFQIAYTQTNTNNGFGSGSNFIPANVGFQAPTALFLMFRY